MKMGMYGWNWEPCRPYMQLLWNRLLKLVESECYAIQQTYLKLLSN